MRSHVVNISLADTIDASDDDIDMVIILTFPNSAAAKGARSLADFRFGTGNMI
jgi:hypothetical protein